MFRDQRDVDRWYGLDPDTGMVPTVGSMRPKGTRSCPHCQSTAPKVCCKTCGREMCEDCVSHDPDVGPVCGLCYDRKYGEQTTINEPPF